MSAIELLERAAVHLKDRAETYDKPEGERSIGATVEAFKAVTGDGLMNTGERGWLFMAILKMVRSQQGDYRADNYEDLAAYSALMGEAACEERNGGWTPEAINEAAFRKSYDSEETLWPAESRIDVIGQDGSECTLQEMIGDAELSDWACWVAVDKSGDVCEYSERPYPSSRAGLWVISSGDWNYIRRADPPSDFTKSIWEVKR